MNSKPKLIQLLSPSLSKKHPSTEQINSLMDVPSPLSSATYNMNFNSTIQNSDKRERLIRKAKGIITRESLVLQLMNDKQNKETINQSTKHNLSSAKKHKSIQKKNRDHSETKLNYMKKEFKDKYDIIMRYEQKIKDLKKEKKDIIAINENIIKMKKQQAQTLKSQIEDLQTQINNQRKYMLEIEDKIKELKEYQKKQESILLQEEKSDEANYKELLEKYNDLTQKNNFYNNEFIKLGETLNVTDINFEDNTLKNNILQKENINIELKEKEEKNINLKLKKNKIEKKIELLEQKIKDEEENEKRKEMLSGNLSNRQDRKYINALLTKKKK